MNLYSLKAAQQALGLDKPLPFIDVIYRLSKYHRLDVSDDLGIVIDGNFATADIPTALRFYTSTVTQHMPFAADFTHWSSARSVTDELGYNLLPPYSDIRNAERLIRNMVGVFECEWDLPADLRYLFPYLDRDRQIFDEELFLAQRTFWQRERATLKLLEQSGVEINCGISVYEDPLRLALTR